MNAISRTDRPRVLAIGLDAPNHDLLTSWMDAGDLPHLDALRQRSARIRVLSHKRFSNEHCWIPVLTGRKRERWPHWLDQWDAERYRYAEASLFDWLEAPLFYAAGDDLRVIAFDVTAPVVAGVTGIQVSGWGTELNESHPRSEPPALIESLHSRYGPDPKIANPLWVTNRISNNRGLSYVIPSLYRREEVDAFADALVRSVDRRTRACLDLMHSEPWDLFLTLFSEIHTAGHVLWHLSQPHPLNALRRDGHDPLLRIYRAVDRSIGELSDALDGEAVIAVYTIDGILADCLENARAVFLPEFLYRWSFPGKFALATGESGGPPPEPRLDYGAHWKYEVWNLRTAEGDSALESPAEQEARGDAMSWCPANWYAPLWPTMQAFALPSVADGYIRLNVAGREAQGIVQACDYGSLCDRLNEDLSQLVNARTGEKLVSEIIRVRTSPYAVDPTEHPADLIVVFGETSPVDVVDSPLIGRIGPVPYFRSASHQSHDGLLPNILYVCGPGIGAGERSPSARLEDIPATLLSLLGMPLPADFDGVSRL